MKLLLSLIFAVIALPVGLGNVATGNVWSGLFACLVALTPLVLTLRSRSAARRDKQARFAALREAVGVDGNAKYEHMEHGTLIILNPGARRLGVSVGGKSKVYSYDDLRSWDVRKVSRGGGAVGYGVTGTVAAGSQNIAASMEADCQTGLFLTVRDIDHPEWRISMYGADDRARWAEILRQEIDEKAGMKQAG